MFSELVLLYMHVLPFVNYIVLRRSLAETAVAGAVATTAAVFSIGFVIFASNAARRMVSHPPSAAVQGAGFDSR